MTPIANMAVPITLALFSVVEVSMLNIEGNILDPDEVSGTVGGTGISGKTIDAPGIL
jgi:hypothetical protein